MRAGVGVLVLIVVLLVVGPDLGAYVQAFGRCGCSVGCGLRPGWALVWLVGGCWRGVVAGAGRGHKVGSVWEQEQQQQQQQSKQGGHVQEHNKREWIFSHGNFSGLKGLA